MIKKNKKKITNIKSELKELFEWKIKDWNFKRNIKRRKRKKYSKLWINLKI